MFLSRKKIINLKNIIMEFGQPDFEASRKKSDEQFEKQAEERNKSQSTSEEKVSGLDVAREEAEVVDRLIKNELDLFEKDNAILDEEYASKFLAIGEVYPNLAGYSRKKLQAMIKNRLEELGKLRDENGGIPEEDKE